MKDISKLIKEVKPECVDLIYPDLLGRLHHLTLPIERWELAKEHGVGFDSSSLPGFGAVEAGDRVLVPDLESPYIDPLTPQRLLCWARIYEARGRIPFKLDPRWIGIQAEALLKKELNLTQALFLPELEFYLFDGCNYRLKVDESFYRVRAKPISGSGYHRAPPEDQGYELRCRVAGLLRECGIGLKYHHHEVGRYGQMEFELDFAPLCATGDRVMLTKYLIRNAAVQANRTATFMPLPLAGEPGSGLHIHQYLKRGKDSFFGDPKESDLLSRAGRFYIAGILSHARALCGITNPSINSYRRLQQGLEAPRISSWGIGDRTGAIRVPGYLKSPEEMRIEYRPPDATANPYLALSAMVLAGLDGVRNQLEIPPPTPLPSSLGEALDALEADQEFLKRDGIFSDELIRTWIGLKRKEEQEFARWPNPAEYQLYYEC